jgi:D-glycero-D-manno-heptose 1,7-bisphosphate phosphatase
MMGDAVHRALFLDRDGVINVDRGYVSLPQETEWVPGIFDLCQRATGMGFRLVVVTNQAGIARGYYSEDQFQAYTAWMHQQFAGRGLLITATYHCPHHPTEGIGPLRRACDCRKPMPGMLLRARNELGIDLESSALIGDKLSDIQAARAAGVGRALLVGTPPPEFAGESSPSVRAAIEWLVSPEQGLRNDGN